MTPVVARYTLAHSRDADLAVLPALTSDTGGQSPGFGLPIFAWLTTIPLVFTSI